MGLCFGQRCQGHTRVTPGQSIPVTPSIPDGDSGEPASKAHYFKMGEDSLPSCLKTTNVQAACICKPYMDTGMESRQPRCGGKAGIYCQRRCGRRQEGRGLPGTIGTSPARYRAVVCPSESCSGLARTCSSCFCLVSSSEAKPCRVHSVRSLRPGCVPTKYFFPEFLVATGRRQSWEIHSFH